LGVPFTRHRPRHIPEIAGNRRHHYPTPFTQKLS
jgi:hypothetical protein